MVIQAGSAMPEHILRATAEVAEQEMIQIRLKRVLMDLTESAAAMKMALLSIWFPIWRRKGQRHTTHDFGEPTGKRNAGGGGSDRNINGAWVENPITTKDAELEMAIEKVAVTVVAVVVLTVTAVMALS